MQGENITLLYRALAERKLFLPGSRKGRALPLPAFSCFAATTDPDRLPPSFRERFVELPLDFYSPEELAAIVRQRAAAMGWETDPEVFDQIGRLGRGIPRLAIRLLSGCREVCRSRGEMLITVEHFEKACELDDRDRRLGLDRVERSLLTFLHDADGPVRLNVLASRLGLTSKTIVMHESFLVRSASCEVTSRGGRLTPRASSTSRGVSPEGNA